MVLLKVLILSLLSITLLFHGQMSFAATYVSGTIYGDVQWDSSNSPYIVESDIVVPSGSSLTIGPGTTVIFEKISQFDPDGYSLRAELIIQGGLYVYGERQLPVVFKGEEGSSVGDWHGIVIESSDVYISDAHISYGQKGIDILSGSPEIKNSIIERCFTGIGIQSGAIPSITRNLMRNNNYGISWYGLGNVYGNRVVYNSYGIYIYEGAQATISYNEISANTFGIYGDKAHAQISGNDFNVEINSYVIYINQAFSGYINNNNFYYDDELEFDPSRELWFVMNESSQNIDAKYNYWDTTNELLIEGYIYDKNNRQELGIVEYEPFLTSPEDQTFHWFTDGASDFPDDGGPGDNDLGDEGIFHVFMEGKNLVSIPAFKLLEQSSYVLGQAGVTFYLWVNGQYSNVEYLELDLYEPGTGFWMESQDSVTIELSGDYEELTEDIFIDLKPGWNLIGTPINKSFDVFLDIGVKHGGEVINMKDAARMGLVEGIWSDDNGGQELVYVMLPWKGYWIRSHVECKLVFLSQE